MILSKSKQFFLSFPKMVILLVLISFFALPTFAQWTAPQVAPTGGDVTLPLNEGIYSQTKQGALVLNSSNAFTVGLAILGRMGIGFSDPNNILSLFHITNGVTGASAYPTTVAPTVRIEGAGPALVTGPWSRIGIGTDNPQYPLDITNTNSYGPSISLGTWGIIIKGGNPQPGYFLTVDNQTVPVPNTNYRASAGVATWAPRPTSGFSYRSAPRNTPGNIEFVNATSQNSTGLISSCPINPLPCSYSVAHTFPSTQTPDNRLKPGLWSVTVYGSAPDGWGQDERFRMNISLQSGTNRTNLPVYVTNNTDGTAPFSVSGFVQVVQSYQSAGFLYVEPTSIKISNNASGDQPIISGVTAYWVRD